MATVTSVYADVWRALYRICSEADWPAPIVAGTPGVIVGFGGFGDMQEPAEACLVVLSATPGDEQQDWATTALGRNETFQTDVDLKTQLLGRTAAETLDRLESMTEVFEALIVANTRQGSQPVEVSARPWWWGVTSTAFTIVPVEAGGFAGFARYTITVQARIGGY